MKILYRLYLLAEILSIIYLLTMFTLLLIAITGCASTLHQNKECKQLILDQNLDNLSNVEELWSKLCT